LALTGSFAAIAQAIVRFFTGWLYDIYGIKPLLNFILVINVIVAFTAYAARYYTPLYILCSFFTYFVFAVIFGSFPTAVS
jgi:hypothetical protein